MIEIGKREGAWAWLCAVPFLAVMFRFEVVPLLAVSADSMFREGSPSVANYREILTSQFYLSAFRASFAISAATALIGLGVALPIAVVLRRMPGRIQQFVLICSN